MIVSIESMENRAKSPVFARALTLNGIIMPFFSKAKYSEKTPAVSRRQASE